MHIRFLAIFLDCLEHSGQKPKPSFISFVCPLPGVISLISSFMAQLLVRDLEDEVVQALKQKAAEEGTSVEEAHHVFFASPCSRKDRGDHGKVWDVLDLGRAP